MIWTLYDIKTGLITGTIMATNSERLMHDLSPEIGCVMGEFDGRNKKVNLQTGEIEDYIPPAPSPNHVWDTETLSWFYVKTVDDMALEARIKRNALLDAADWVTLRAMRTNTAIPSEWRKYQRDLADISSQPGFPVVIEWPELPTTN